MDITPIAHSFMWILPICTYSNIMTYYDITMGNDVATNAHCNMTMGNSIARDIHCNITMSNDIAMCIMHNDVAMNLFWYVLLCLLMILLSLQ